MRRSIFLDNTIEFLKGRVYLGAYDFTPDDTDEIVFFTVEDSIFYNSFHLDFGPLNIGHLYRFAVIFHEILNNPENSNKAVVFYSSASSRQRANAACMLCCYMVLVQGWTPHQVLQPLAQVDPPFMPFRDAGYSNADFEISIQDVAYGVWRAKEKGLIDLHSFNLETYEKYEHVENGDFNVLTPDFIAFASPQEDMRLNGSFKSRSHLNQPFRSVLKFFSENDVQLVVRLNSHLYNKQHFENSGIQHIDMIFEDGTCPDLSIVQNFIGAADTIIRRGGKIAVHCKAGLGRTGCLIGAHLIHTYGFTANECIGFLRFIRPGMVVGPQQHWLYLHQNEFREWKYTMRVALESSELIGDLYPLITNDDYKIQKKRLRDATTTAASASLTRENGRKGSNNLESNLRDLNMTPQKPSMSSTTRNSAIYSNQKNNMATSTGNNNIASQMDYARKAVPQNSPGQPRKGQNGTNTIEDIKTNKTRSNNENEIDMNENDEIIDTIDGDTNMLTDNNSDEEDINSKPVSITNISRRAQKIQQSNQDDAAEEEDDAMLKQLLPKNRRTTSGRRTPSSAGGIRKISGTTKK
ncbi:similar to Saccharomyces cerevisiae YFR028C CDC14 Protein phosphatase required for mitotic exit [Maudiozyma barnettii]|uniref:Tyrosine-protein phosphatase CDC14 n=1 Tax=Maudiozyma barnettii TaxID=61262 RepID=A0A8H2VEU4_9SACH|nr:phosphoprotein phosphatase CDC14 [Kazachstania barnettii]CAB4254235.1 similar to Saccharomyces cerevisiae YFR028C CDC14 Protein phosphatase required for mitotic exit [Kazachstania barnettii]CAD1781981.1 similar to Saccharomyces cerevisiae YFR028C CDC14 Protein phosphatase required for mitotic exit [Kazachstania barnettii]